MQSYYNDKPNNIYNTSYNKENNITVTSSIL